MEKINLNLHGFGIAGNSDDAKNYNNAYSDYTVGKHNLSQSAHFDLFNNMKAYTDNNITLLHSDITGLNENLLAEKDLRVHGENRLQKNLDEYAYITNTVLEDNKTRIAILEQSESKTDEKLEALKSEIVSVIGDSWEAEV